MGIAPGYISRSVAGSYDNEAIAIFLLVFTFYLWIKAVKVGSVMWGGLTALFYGYMVSAWGGYVFITNLLPLHAFVLICMGRFSPRLYVSYTTWYALGTLASMQIPFVGFLPIRSSEHMSALGKFGLESVSKANTNILQASLVCSSLLASLSGFATSSPPSSSRLFSAQWS
jgi:dolichyl-diphosphooligosaccharide--protein glycosyltransferase